GRHRRWNVRVPDGDPVRDRTPRLHRRLRWRRDRGLERDPASELAATRHRLDPRASPREGSHPQPGPRWRVRWEAACEIRTAARVHGAPRRPAGATFIPGDTPADGIWAEAVQRAARRIGWGTPLPAGRGRGVAVGLKSGPTTGLSHATVRLLADGSVVVYSGTSDMGQGARTIFAQIAAHELGAPLEWVTVVMGDTAVVPYDQQTSASRSSVIMGNAVLAACRDVQAKIRAMAATLEDVPA